MEQRVINPWTWQDAFGYQQGREVTGPERLLWISGQTSTGADGNPLHDGDMGAQVHQVVDNLDAVLAQADMTLADLVRIQILTTDIDLFFQHMEELNGRLTAAGSQHTSTVMGVVRLAMPQLLVEIEATAAA